jgi:hypothetical protein
MELQVWSWPPIIGELQPRLFFFGEQSNRMHTTSLLLSPASILCQTNSNLWISRDFVFQINSDFISKSNLNRSGLLPHPYISLGAPPHVSSHQFRPNINPSHHPSFLIIAATLSSPPPLFLITPAQLNLVPVVRSQIPNPRRKNHVDT